MLVTILIATIIHMNMGYELGEAIARGIGSAAILAGISTAVTLIGLAIIYIIEWLRDR